MKPLRTVSVGARVSSFLLAILTSGLVLGATVSGMLPVGDGLATGTLVAMERFTHARHSVN